MQITILEHRGHIEYTQGQHGHFWAILADHDAREFRIACVEGSLMHNRILAEVLDRATENEREYWDCLDDARAALEETWQDNGSLWTRNNDGTVLLITMEYVSVFLPVTDDFEDQETHWVGAVPVLRRLLAH